ncbi:hypothetical protein PYCC9005_001980 [Savitreella phatthalungensis]
MSFTAKPIQAIALKPSRWTPTFSFTGRDYNAVTQRDAEARKLLKHYFQHYLCSTPQVERAPGRVRLRMYIHESKECKPSVVRVPSNSYALDGLKSKVLEKVYGKGTKIELDVQPLSAPYLNAEIAAQYLALMSKKRSFTALTQRFIKSTPLGAAVDGLKLQVSGRLGRRKGAGRKSVVSRQKGKLGFASHTSPVEAARCEFKNRNGKIGVVVWIRSGRSLIPGNVRTSGNSARIAAEKRMREYVARWRAARQATPQGITAS